jgi:phage terminase large subunit-like protein
LRLDRTAIDLGHDAVRAATGRSPRWLVTTTPKPIRLLRDLLALEGHGVVITRDSTLANAANLPPAFIEAVTKRYGGTRLGRQELNAELLEDTPGALWTRAIPPLGIAGYSDADDWSSALVIARPRGSSRAPVQKHVIRGIRDTEVVARPFARALRNPTLRVDAPDDCCSREDAAVATLYQFQFEPGNIA